MHRSERIRTNKFAGRDASTVGLGPCRERGDENPRAIVRAIALGCNVLDTAPYVHRGEHARSLGQAVRVAVAEGLCERDHLVVNTTIGRVPDLIDTNIRSHGFARLKQFVEERYVAPGVFTWHDLAGSGYVIAPNYLRRAVADALADTGLDRFDCVFLESPAIQRDAVSPAEYRRRMIAAFAALEQLCADGRARCYGVASAAALDLDELVALAESAAGPDHRLRAVRAPFSLLRQDMRPFVDAAVQRGLHVFAAGCLDGGTPRYDLPPEFAAHFGDAPDPLVAIRWIESAPGVGTALFASRDERHVQAILAAASLPPLDPALYAGGPS